MQITMIKSEFLTLSFKVQVANTSTISGIKEQMTPAVDTLNFSRLAKPQYIPKPPCMVLKTR